MPSLKGALPVNFQFVAALTPNEELIVIWHKPAGDEFIQFNAVEARRIAEALRTLEV